MSMELVETKRSPVTLYGGREYYEFRRYVSTRKRQIIAAYGALSRDMGRLITPDSARAIIRHGKLPAQIRDEWAKLTSGFVMDSVMPEYRYTIDLASEAIRKRILRAKAIPPPMESAGIWANERGGTLLVDLTASQMKNAQAVIHAQVIWGVTSPHQLAQMMKPMVGLTQREAIAVSRFYQGLVAEGISPQNAVGRLDKYAKFLHANRADRIARTELSDAYNFGQMNTIRGALDEGLLEGEIEKEWIAGGANPCDICTENEAAGFIKLNAAFPSGDDTPTAHPDCECAVGYKAKRSAYGESESRRGTPAARLGQAKRGTRGHLSWDEMERVEAMGHGKYSIERIQAEHFKMTGKKLSDKAADDIYAALQGFVGDASTDIRLAQLNLSKKFEDANAFKVSAKKGGLLEDYLKFAPQFSPETTIYRGVGDTGHKGLLKKLKSGEVKAGDKIKLDTTSHWSSELHVADEWDGSIIWETKGVRQSSAISQYSEIIPEQEVMVSRLVEYLIKSVKVESGRYRIVLEATG